MKEQKLFINDMNYINQHLEIQKEYKVGIGVCVTNTIVVYLMFLGVLMKI